MLRYSKGLGKYLNRFIRVFLFKLKCLRGVCCSYKVYRPDVDHTVYEEDNKKLLSTFKNAATIHHVVSNSLSRPLNRYQIIEMEHPFALVGHLGIESDYRLFRQSWLTDLRRFISGFDSRRHRIIASSIGARNYLNTYLRSIDFSMPEDGITQIYWGLSKKREIINVVREIRVFHSGGMYPYSKGTRDVIDLARRFPSVKFCISVDLSSSLVKSNSSPNIEFVDVWSKREYLRGLRESNLFLLPLYGDGWGAPLEALAYAIPIIGYNTFDKNEIVIHNRNGFLIDVPRHTSFYDGFFDGDYGNWSEYNEFIADSDNSKQVDSLCFALEKYCSIPKLIKEHSAAGSKLFDETFSSAGRLQKIRPVYNNLIVNARSEGG